MTLAEDAMPRGPYLPGRSPREVGLVAPCQRCGSGMVAPGGSVVVPVHFTGGYHYHPDHRNYTDRCRELYVFDCLTCAHRYVRAGPELGVPCARGRALPGGVPLYARPIDEHK